MSVVTGSVQPSVVAVIAAARIEGSILKLTGDIDRKLYLETNKVLEALGGKWDRSKKGHVFAGDPAAIIDQVIATGEYIDPKLNGFFPTPPDLAAQVIARAMIQPGMTVLEPSAGHGALAILARDIVGERLIDCYELLPDNTKILRDLGFPVVFERDFLTVTDPTLYDRVVMNPPFTRGEDVKHVTHAIGFVRKGGGRLVSIMSAGMKFRTDKATTSLREYIEQMDGSITDNPDGSFVAAGTNVRTVMVVIDR